VEDYRGTVSETRVQLSPKGTAKQKPVTTRAVVVGLALAAVNTYWVVLAEVRLNALDGSCLPLFVTPIFILSLLTVTNIALNAVRPRWALTQVELVTVYIIVVICETLGGHDFVQNLFGTIGHAHWFATPENQWAELFFDYLPSWLVVSDHQSLKLFYEGGASFLQPEASGPFLIPLAAWAGVLLSLITAMLCINIFLEGHWIGEEKLAYPLIALPLHLTKQSPRPGTFFRNPFVWAGFGVAALITIINGLNVLIPAIPHLRYIKLTTAAFTEAPWTAFYRLYYGIYPFAVALAFFIPSDLSFSCWFFFLGGQAQLIVAQLLGMLGAQPQGFPYLAQQGAGAWLALAVGALLVTHRHLARIWRLLWANDSQCSDAEAKLYRWAAVGLISSLGILVLLLSYAGMGVSLVAGFLLIFYLLSIAITRVRASFGAPHEIYYINPQQILVNIAGTTTFGARQLTALSTTYWFNRCYRCHPMPFQLESLKMAELTSIDLRAVLRTIVLATAAGILLSYWANLQIMFRAGAAGESVHFKSWVGSETYVRLAHWLQTMPGPNYPAILAIIAGASIFWGLRWLHFQTMLPVHPAGYALAVSFAMNYFWCSFLVGWLVKVLVLRYGGRATHVKAFSFFLGVLLGDYFVGSVWALIGSVWRINTYRIFI